MYEPPQDSNSFTYKPRTKYREIQNSLYMGKKVSVLQSVLYTGIKGIREEE